MCGANAGQRQEAASRKEGTDLQALGPPVLGPPAPRHRRSVTSRPAVNPKS